MLIAATLAALVLLPTACSTGGLAGPPAPSGTSSAAPVDSEPPAVPTGTLLPPVDAYVQAVNGEDLDGLVAAFAAEAELVDVGRRFSGQAAIRGWAEREVIGGKLTVTEVAEERPGYQRLLVRFAPGGTGGFAAVYAFTVDGGSITKAELTYA